MNSEKIELKLSQLDIDRANLKAELMRPPFFEGLSTKRWRNVKEDSYFQIPHERLRPQEEK